MTIQIQIFLTSAIVWVFAFAGFRSAILGEQEKAEQVFAVVLMFASGGMMCSAIWAIWT